MTEDNRKISVGTGECFTAYGKLDLDLTSASSL